MAFRSSWVGRFFKNFVKYKLLLLGCLSSSDLMGTQLLGYTILRISIAVAVGNIAKQYFN